MPLITVVMPAKNAADYISEAVYSIVNQSLKDFEIIVIDDGSTDATLSKLDKFSGAINFRVIRHESSRGVAHSINAGIMATDSEFVARMDADDISHLDRFSKQITLLREKPDIDLCGSLAQVFSVNDGVRSNLYLKNNPLLDADIKTWLVHRCPIQHATVMVRRNFFQKFGLYDPEYDFAEDYELWTRAAIRGAKFHNIQEILCDWRRHDGQVTIERSQIQHQRDIKARSKYIAGLLGVNTGDLLAMFFSQKTRFKSAAILDEILPEIFSQILKLSEVAPSKVEFSKVIASAFSRHYAPRV